MRKHAPVAPVQKGGHAFPLAEKLEGIFISINRTQRLFLPNSGTYKFLVPQGPGRSPYRLCVQWLFACIFILMVALLTFLNL